MRKKKDLIESGAGMSNNITWIFYHTQDIKLLFMYRCCCS